MPQPQTQGPDSISQAIMDIVDAGLATFSGLADGAGVDRSTISRMAAGETDPTLRTLRSMLKAAPAAAQRRLLAVVTDGLPFDVRERASSQTLDVNHDGRVDPVDAMAVAVDANGQLAKIMADINDAAMNGSLSHAQKSAAMDAIATLRKRIELTEDIVANSTTRQKAGAR